MTVKLAQFIKPVVKNGVGSFVLPITLQYCNWGGSSNGMRQLLSTQIKSVAAKYPDVEFVLKKKSGHPTITGEYGVGKTQTVSVRNATLGQIKEQIEFIHDNRGNAPKKYKYPVKSTNESVRGVWSPFHTNPDFRFKI
ncbi:hypothetical protein D0Z00_004622 [Geotrichum galactomycetum]|uniref:Uncharacterized protein n=1 Tax=Geotrichum galactomycetum TaxID=27317 RepID=A0ACB6UXX1_9ASCO|nr:hypothetical protein D0Z00_004622 [Geotrichum candidum]